MFNLAFSTNAFKRNSLDEAIDAIAAAGFRGVELMADIPHAYPPDLGPGARATLLKKTQSLGLAVSNINAFTLFALGDTYHPTWIEHDQTLRNRRIDHTVQCLELAADMQTKSVSIQPGGPLIGTTLNRTDAQQSFADALALVLPAAERLDITLAIEPEPGLLIQTAGEYREFKRTHFSDNSRIKMNCDIGHLFCVQEDSAQVIRSMPDEIAHVHLEDIGANRVHQHLAPGKGCIDFRSIFAALNEIGYAGWVTVELYPYEATAAEIAKQAFRYLQPLLNDCE
jgi:sugar phosphate isomerase/epimerase